MKKITSRNQLEQVIVQIIKEQLNMQKNYQQGKQQGVAAGQATKQAVVKGVNELSRVGKEVLVTIANTSFKILTIGVGAAAYTIWLIGTGVWKCTTAVSNALIKFISSAVKVTIGGALALSNAALDILKRGGIVISQGAQAFMNGIKSLQEKGAAVIKWFVGLCAKFGAKVYAKVLAGINNIAIIASVVGNWLGQQWSTIEKSIGFAWGKAKQLGSNVLSGIKSVGSAVGNAGKSALNYGSKIAGNVGGFIKGLFEIFERFNNFTSHTTLRILNEARYINATIL